MIALGCYDTFSQLSQSTLSLRHISSACQPRRTGNKSATPISGHKRGMKCRAALVFDLMIMMLLALFFLYKRYRSQERRLTCHSKKSLIRHTPEVLTRISGSGSIQPLNAPEEVYKASSSVFARICLSVVSA